MDRSIGLEISEQKALKITYSVLGIMAATLFGFAAWMTSVELTARADSTRIAHIQGEQDKVGDYLMSIDKRLSRIEIMLERFTK